MAIYTKKGDKGETKVFDRRTGKLVGISKKSCKVRAVGAIDELNSLLGVTKSFSEDSKLQKKLSEIQGNLFVINSIIAGGNLRFSKVKTKKLEREIDGWEGSLPVLKNFIYYEGDRQASLIFYARALCRKAERSLVALSLKKPVNPELLTYLNRLSDYLFMLGRSINFEKKIKEEYWIGNKNK